MLFLLVAVTTASATVAGPSKFASSKVMTIRGGSSSVTSSNSVSSENLVKIFATWWVYTNVVEKDGKFGDDVNGFFGKGNGWLKVGICWFLFQHFDKK